MRRISSKLIFFGLSYLIAVMMIKPDLCISTARDAVELCLDTVIPSLFPFFVCSNLFVTLGGAKIAGRYLSPIMKPLFGVSGGGSIAFVLGIICGYPIGAATAAQLYSSGNCSKIQAERLLSFCNNSGPLFIIGAVGTGMLKSTKLGIFLYIVHLLSSVLTGIIFRNYGKEITYTPLLPAVYEVRKESVFSAVGSSVSKSVDNILKVCGFVIFFSVFSSAIPQFKGYEFAYSFVEITGGLKAVISEYGTKTYILPIISFFIAFSGISVLMQVCSIVLPYNLSVKPYILGKLTQGLISALLTMAGQMIISFEQPVFGYSQVVCQLNFRGIWVVAVLVIVMFLYVKKSHFVR